MNKVVVIGGGAAGMMAAIAAGRSGAMVTLLEQNEKLGKKIYITGKGRCNVTNACDTEDFFGNVVRNPKFLFSAIYGFDHGALMELISNAGCELKIERGNRVFPVSDRASDITAALYGLLKECGVTVFLQAQMKEIVVDGDRVTNVRYERQGKMQSIDCDKVILATGGVSYASTGSRGDGHAICKKLGMEEVELKPALVPLVSDDEVCKQLQGLSLKNVEASLYCDGKCIYQEMGEMLFTHEGVSGPLILSASSYYANYVRKKKKDEEKQAYEASLVLDLKPALTEDTLDKRVLREFEDNKNKQFKNAIDRLFPKKLVPIMVKQSGIDGDTPVYQITKEQRKQFVRRIKEFRIPITRSGGFHEAIITQGGIAVKEINPSTMESKKVRGLYLAGELLDVDALTGGFNLQIAFSTGYLAGESAAKEEDI